MYGVNSKSESLIVRVFRIPNGQSEAWIYLKLSDGREFCLDPTNGYQSSTDGKNTAFTCGGLRMYPLCAMRRWRISFSGMLKYKCSLLFYFMHMFLHLMNVDSYSY